MRRAHDAGDGATAAEAASAAVAPLLRLRRAADKAEDLARFSRALELVERALAAAELAQPSDSLIIAALLNDQDLTRSRIRLQESQADAAVSAEQVELKLRALHVLHARWQAGTLFLPTAEETAYLLDEEAHCLPGLPAQMCGAFLYIRAAMAIAEVEEASVFVSFPCTLAETEARLHGVYGGLRTALEMDARGVLEHDARTATAWRGDRLLLPARTISCLACAVYGLVTRALSDSVGLLSRLRATCGLAPAEETALCQLAARCKAAHDCVQPELRARTEKRAADGQQTAVADAARHGLRRCALPCCGAQEAHPKLFKLCGRCRGAAYCCAAHSVEDWKRHKREDGCTAAAQA
jgi:hypothetical protein